MNKKERTERKVNSFLNNHIWLRYVLDYVTAFIASVISAAIFSFGIVCFLKPGCDGMHDLVSGGSSGAAQLITLGLEMIFPSLKEAFANQPNLSNLVFSICYVCVNLPLIFLAFKGIGKRFAIFTCVNVAAVFLFSNIFVGDFFNDVARFINANGGLLSRALFAGLCTGLSSAIAFKFETSAGGFDIVSYYVSLRKSSATGPYIALINGFIIFSFYFLSAVNGSINGITETLIIGGTPHEISPWTLSIAGILFSLVYIVETILIVDLINTRNKKVQLQIITSNSELPRLMLANIPHGATIIKGQGAYSGEERLIIYAIISSGELKKTIRLIREIDPKSFINVSTLQQVYGRFFIKPVK